MVGPGVDADWAARLSQAFKFFVGRECAEKFPKTSELLVFISAHGGSHPVEGNENATSSSFTWAGRDTVHEERVSDTDFHRALRVIVRKCLIPYEEKEIVLGTDMCAGGRFLKNSHRLNMKNRLPLEQFGYFGGTCDKANDSGTNLLNLVLHGRLTHAVPFQTEAEFHSAFEKEPTKSMSLESFPKFYSRLVKKDLSAEKMKKYNEALDKLQATKYINNNVTIADIDAVLVKACSIIGKGECVPGIGTAHFYCSDTSFGDASFREYVNKWWCNQSASHWFGRAESALHFQAQWKDQVVLSPGSISIHPYEEQEWKFELNSNPWKVSKINSAGEEDDFSDESAME